MAAGTFGTNACRRESGEGKRSRPGTWAGEGRVLTRVVGRHYLFVIIDDLCVLVCLCEVCHGVWACGGGPWLMLVLMSVKMPIGDGVLPFCSCFWVLVRVGLGEGAEDLFGPSVRMRVIGLAEVTCFA